MKMDFVKGHQTQWAAQFAVASELCKRGYEVAFTLGHNTPMADLMVISPKKETAFLIDVKGLAKRNAWLVKRRPVRKGLYYVFAFTPMNEANRFFIMSHSQVNKTIDAHLKRNVLQKGWRDGFGFPAAFPFEDRWDAFPQ